MGGWALQVFLDLLAHPSGGRFNLSLKRRTVIIRHEVADDLNCCTMSIKPEKIKDWPLPERDEKEAPEAQKKKTENKNKFFYKGHLSLIQRSCLKS